MRRIAGLLAVLVLAGCGGDGGQSPAEALAAAAERMGSEESARFTFTATMVSRDLSDKTIPFSGEGVSTFAESEEGRLTMDLAEMFEILIAEEVTDPEQREFVEALFGDPTGWRAEIRTVGGAGYMRVPALTNLIGGDPWVKFDETDEEEESGIDIVFGDSPNPGAFLRYLRALGEVEEVGSERIGGRQTTHYRGTVELERVPDEVPEDEREALRERIQRAIEQTGQRTVPIEVWVDEEGLLRRIKFTDVSPPAKDEKFPTTFQLTMDMTDYGVVVEVEAPPADQVMSESQFDELTEGGGT